jgi:hypothetical protein
MGTIRKLIKALTGQGMHRQLCCYENALLELGGDVDALDRAVKKYLP